MAPLERLGADDLRAVVQAYRDALRSHQEAINRLNVYPVPDGDTGTNMALTVESVLAELEGAETDMASVCKAVAHGALMGARGNSGVILSQILRGLTTVFSGAGADGVDGPTFAWGLATAAEGAYKAVGRPVEGTILTVVREAAEAAGSLEADEPPLVEVLEVALTRGGAALERTPELLDVLRQAGVVDAGGAGFLLLLDAALCVVAGRPLPAPDVDAGAVAPVERRPEPGAEAGSDLRYEVMHLLEAPDDTIPALREAWAGIGDSVAIVGGDGLWNCHVHTDDVGAAIEAAIDCGRPRQIRVTDLSEQVEEERWVREGSAPPRAQDAPPPPTTAVVAVANGDGLRQLFESLGVGAVVAGGQSMNPSTASLADAVEQLGSGSVIILPNNGNIVAVAEQVDGVSAKDVRVVPTRAAVQGMAALLAYDPAAGVDDNARAMAAAAEGVVAGEVTRAVRDSVCDAGPIREGDWLGIAGGGVKVVDDTLVGATVALLDALVGPDHEIVTLIVGEGAGADDTAGVTEWLGAQRPDVEVEVHQGGQPLYPYLLGIE
ncbi:MAG: DAK2 domain-containing protein [Actinobacteria bacterium]|nr:DAK2 domain-containing protein [Actinomycetota bacterium]